MKAGKRVLIAAHGNSLRGIVKHLDEMSDEAIMGLNLPTGIPFVYELDENFKPVVSMKVLKVAHSLKMSEILEYQTEMRCTAMNIVLKPKNNFSSLATPRP